jgi:hypothetical protein
MIERPRRLDGVRRIWRKPRKAQRNLTESEFEQALAHCGMRLVGSLGYVEIGFGTLVSCLNAGRLRREQLTYLLHEQVIARIREGIQ